MKLVNESAAMPPFDRVTDFFEQHCKSSLSWLGDSIKRIGAEIT